MKLPQELKRHVKMTISVINLSSNMCFSSWLMRWFCEPSFQKAWRLGSRFKKKVVELLACGAPGLWISGLTPTRPQTLTQAILQHISRESQLVWSRSLFSGPHLPPCRACSLHPLFWPQSPPGGHWCQSRTFSLGPECWSVHWRASHLERDIVGKMMREDTAKPALRNINRKLKATVMTWSSDYLCVSLTGYCADALMPWQSVEWKEKIKEKVKFWEAVDDISMITMSVLYAH